MNLDPGALADALRSHADALHREAMSMPTDEMMKSGLLADINKLRDAAQCIDRREHDRQWVKQ